MVGIVVVSHSSQLARGLAALAGQMAGPRVPIELAGGTADGQLAPMNAAFATRSAPLTPEAAWPCLAISAARSS